MTLRDLERRVSKGQIYQAVSALFISLFVLALVVLFYYVIVLLLARRRPQGLVVIGVCLSVCLSVCLCALFCPQDISRTGSWITTKFGGWEHGVNL